MAFWSARRLLEDQSVIWRLLAGVAVALVTVPEMVTLALGVAYGGFTEVIAIDSGSAAWSWPARPLNAPAGAAGAASAAERVAATAPVARASSRTPAPCPDGTGRRRPVERH